MFNRKSAGWLISGAALVAVSLGSIGLYVFEPEIRDAEISQQQSQLVDRIHKTPSARQPKTESESIALLAVEDVTANGQVFATIRVPRFGTEWKRLVAEGTVWEPSLNTFGVGHYRGTAFPGEVGNFAVAGHRGGFGGTFRNIHKLTTGDMAEVVTTQATHLYRFVESTVVTPYQIGVIAKVPKGLGSAKPGGRYMTLTSCDPIWENTNRIIAWFELVDTKPNQ